MRMREGWRPCAGALQRNNNAAAYLGLCRVEIVNALCLISYSLFFGVVYASMSSVCSLNTV